MRSLHELYTILYDEIKDKNTIYGLCHEINRLIINNKIDDFEYSILIKHFESQKPNVNLHPEFLDSLNWNDGENWIYCEYWWKNEEDLNPINRKAFIKK